MALLNLIAKLGLDTGEFNARLAQSEQRAGFFARKFKSSLEGGLGRFVTAGFAVNILRDIIANVETLNGVTEQTIKNVNELEKGWMNVADAAKSSAANVIEFASKNPAAGAGPFNLMAFIGRKIGAALSPENVTEELGRLERRLGAAEQKSDLRKKEGKEIEKELARTMAIAPGPMSLTMPSDPLARIGGFTGGAGDKFSTTQERIAKATEATAKNTADGKVVYQ